MWTRCRCVQDRDFNSAKSIGIGRHKQWRVHPNWINRNRLIGNGVARIVNQSDVECEVFTSNRTVFQIQIQRCSYRQHRISSTVECIVSRTKFIEIDSWCIFGCNQMGAAWEGCIQCHPCPPSSVALSCPIGYSEGIGEPINIERQGWQHRRTIPRDNCRTIVRHQGTSHIESTTSNRVVGNRINNQDGD